MGSSMHLLHVCGVCWIGTEIDLDYALYWNEPKQSEATPQRVLLTVDANQKS
jgi:hypothetical protein